MECVRVSFTVCFADLSTVQYFISVIDGTGSVRSLGMCMKLHNSIVFLKKKENTETGSLGEADGLALYVFRTKCQMVSLKWAWGTLRR